MINFSTMTGGGAHLSECRVYRYLLWRRLPPTLQEAEVRTCAFIMLNPSTADANADDPTIRRCLGYCRSWGYGQLIVANLFALRATQPRDLYKHEDPVGAENDQAIRLVAANAHLIIAAWGVHGTLRDRHRQVRELLAGRPLHYLRLSAAGMPWHPLYLKGDLQPKLWE